MATSLALASALEDSTDLLLERNVHIYGSVCMKTGIDLNTLADNKVMLEKLLELDRRGGIFSQQCMEQGLITALTNKDQLVSMQAKKTANMESGGEVVALVAYKIRVMLAHIRKAYDACQDFDNHKLKDLFTICSAQKEPTTKKARKDIRLGRRPHPFLAFRCNDGEEEEDDYIGIEPQFVTKYFDLKLQVGVILFDDGTEYQADSYEAGPHGFIVCKWLEPRMDLETEIPNVFLQDGVIATLQDVAPKGKAKAQTKFKPLAKVLAVPVLKRPASADHSQAEEEEEEGEEPQQQHLQSEVGFKAVPGKKGDWTVVVFNKQDKADKAQILHIVKDRISQHGHTTREMCENIASSLKGSHAQELSAPIKSQVDQLDMLRRCAKALKDSLL